MIVKAGIDKNPSGLELSNRALARRAACESFVLLENDGILPLKEEKIALYGSGARMTVKGGTGSGAVRERYSVSIAQGLENAGIKIATNQWLDRFDKYYQDTYEAYCQNVEKRVEGVREFFKILQLAGQFEHPAGIPVTDEDIRQSRTDTAIYVLARQAGEGSDREDRKGDYRLEDIEFENLKKVSNGYKNLIVVVNAGGVLDLSFLETLHVSALVYFVQGGEEGGNALADVLTGKENFSGKLATSWAYEFSDIPSNTTYSYLGKDKYNQEYNEGIYVGYRYFDSFRVKPRYAFGYGLSYTDFEMEMDRIVQKKDRLEVDILVKNTGGCSGKEVVQLYASVPFGKDGAEYQRLTAFAKTSLLEPGKTEMIHMTADIRGLTRYDEHNAAYVLLAGTYILRLGNASNNTKAAAVLRVEDDIVTEQCAHICPVQHTVEEIAPPLRKKEDLPQDLEGIDLDVSCLKTIVHEYVTPKYEGTACELADQMSIRQLAELVCGGGTSARNLVVSAMGASGTTTAELYEEFGIPNIILADGPAGLNLTSQIVEMPDGTFKSANVPEIREAYKRYLFGFSKIALMGQMAKPEEGTLHYQYATAWPCSQLLAQSFNTSLLEEIGDAVGKEMETYGVTVWLAPGMNIHRNPLCGRTFEYYSEDPFVSGKMAAALVRGVQSHPGKGMSIKHFVANNCELERNASSSNMNERALRELYLKGFEIAVKESEPMTVMASYNMINGVYVVNNYDLLVKVLRNEWGFQGLVMSDWDSMKCEKDDCMNAVTGDVLKAFKAQCDLIMPGRPDQIEALVKGAEEGLVSTDDMKRSAARVIAMIQQNTVCKIRKKQSHTEQTAIYPGKVWLDTKGERIQAHGGAMFYEDGMYYWYGENKEKTDGKNGIWTWGIRAYSSKDLYNWEDKGVIIPPDTQNSESSLYPEKHVDRPHILKCKHTGKYVCWIKLSGPDACFTLLTADHFLGPYHMEKNTFYPLGQKVGDFDLVEDEDSQKAYLFMDSNHAGIVCMELAADYLDVTREVSRQYEGLHAPFCREGIAVFERQGKKYMLTSGMSGYIPNQSDSAVSDSWTESFVSIGDPHVDDESKASFNSQISKVFQVYGKKDLYIAMADRWVPGYKIDAKRADIITRAIAAHFEPDVYRLEEGEKAELMNSPLLGTANTSAADYVWLPLRFEGEKVFIEWKDEWKVEDYES